MNTVAEKIAEMIGPSLEAMGYELVRVQLTGSSDQCLQIMAERQNEANMTVEDCAEISRMLSALLDVEDPIPGEYRLEVSSPGIDRPLTRLADFDRFAGLDAKVETRLPVDGRRRFKGRLDGTEGENIRLNCEAGPVTLSFADVAKAKLILTDELLALAAQQQEAETQ
jgi:ribosome maturation factor RimP